MKSIFWWGCRRKQNKGVDEENGSCLVLSALIASIITNVKSFKILKMRVMTKFIRRRNKGIKFSMFVFLYVISKLSEFQLVICIRNIF